MADVVEMPKLGFDMAEGTLVRWVRGEGDTVNRGDVLAEIETDKATVEVESAYTGIIHKHLVPEGEIVPVGTPIAVIGQTGEDIDLSKLAGGASPVTAGESDAPSKVVAAEPTKTETGDLLATDTNGHFPEGVKASPVARRMADEHGLDVSAIKGSGPGGRIVKADIEAYLESPPTLPVGTPPGKMVDVPQAVATLPQAVFSPLGPVQEDKHLPVNRLRAAIGRRMVDAKQQVPHFYVTHNFDMGQIMLLRQQINNMLDGTGEKLSVNDFIIKATAMALRQFPNLNASYHGDEIIQYGAINIGIAVAVDSGLLTVVCANADRKPLRQISIEVRTMAGRVRQGKVKPEDIEGSTFSISNLGMFDVESFTAIINPPEAAILATGSVVDVPVVKDGEISVGSRMNATISVDHRVSDGAEAAQFLQALAVYLEEPLRLML